MIERAYEREHEGDRGKELISERDGRRETDRKRERERKRARETMRQGGRQSQGA